MPDPIANSVSVPPVVTVSPVRKPTNRLAFAGSFLKWVFSGFGMLGDKDGEEAVLYSVQQGFFLWAMMLVSFVGAFWVHHWPGSAAFWGWAYVLSLFYTLVLIFGELNTWRFAFWAGVVTLVYLLIRYPLGWIGIVPGLSHWLARLSPAANHDLLFLSGLALGVLFLGSLGHTFAQGRKTITPNSIEEWHFGRGNEIQDRGGLRFQTTYRDILETVLGFGAGDLVAYDRAGRVVKRYPNVLFLFFKWKKLDVILHQRFAVVDNVAGDVVDVHEIHDVSDHPVA